jgi:type IV pilus assembly protein PilN
MIKINLLPVKKKKKAKPVPSFIVAAVAVTIISCLLLGYLVYYFNGRIASRKQQVDANEKTLAKLKEKIKAVEDYEKRNATYKQRKDIIEQLGKNKILPVKVIDEVSRLLPSGVWLTSMAIDGTNVNLGCMGFTNTDVVNYVNNLKTSKLFTDVFLQESVQQQASGFSVYSFRLTFKVKE